MLFSMQRRRGLKLVGYFVLGVHVFFLLDVFIFHKITNTSKHKQNEGHLQNQLDIKPDQRKLPTVARQRSHQSALDRLNKDYAEQNDPNLITAIREDWLDKPWDGVARHVDKKYPSDGLTKVLSRLLKKEGGFFFEYIAGVQSFTLYLEQEKKWTGLLLEPDPEAYRLLRQRKRKVYTANACLSVKAFPTYEEIELTSFGNDTKARKTVRNIECQFFPLLSLLLAVKHTDVDFLSLRISRLHEKNDVLNLLKAIRFENINVQVMAITVARDMDAKNIIQYYLERYGFKFIIDTSNKKYPQEITLVFSKDQSHGHL